MTEDNKKILCKTYTKVSHALIQEVGLYKAMILGILVRKANYYNTNSAFNKKKDFANQTGLSEKTVFKFLQELNDAGYITINKGMGRNNNQYVLNVKKINEIELNYSQETGKAYLSYEEETGKAYLSSVDEETGKLGIETGKLGIETGKVETETGKAYMSKKEKYNTDLLAGSIKDPAEGKVEDPSEPNGGDLSVPTLWGVNVDVLKKWVDYIILPQYQRNKFQDEDMFNKRQRAGKSLVDVLNENNLTIREFLLQVYPTLIGHQGEDTLQAKLYNHLKTK